jgi:tetratricopeptide (TPR) repeat protein
MSKMPVMPELTPEQKAVEKFNAGTRHLDRAAKLEEKDAAKAQGEFAKAIKDFESATKINPKFTQAYSQLGFALRKSGRHADALVAYDKALELLPNFSPALEYRAEAYLGLNRVEEVKQAYMILFSGDRARADELAAAMKKWVAARRAEPGSVPPETIASFEKWLSERREIATQTSDLRTPKQPW